MNYYRFHLDNTRPNRLFTCPSCNHKTLKRYVDEENNQYLPQDVGRCNREVNCGYHFTPKHYFSDHFALPERPPNAILPLPRKPPAQTFIDKGLMQRTLSANANNHFKSYLKTLFGPEPAGYLAEKFLIGTSKHWPGAVIFWQINVRGQIHAGKVMLYDASSGKRVKKPYDHIQWVHALQKWPDFKLHQCFFGLHQLANVPTSQPIAVVESEKTAILMTLIFPKYVWLASGGMGLQEDKFEPLAKRKIILFPDAGIDRGQGTPYEKWLLKAEVLQKADYDVSVSTLVEKAATGTQRQQGFDLADYLIQQDPDFGWALTENDYPVFWNTNF
ncbi:DUF6371 domain-containing protein [Runella aurantiaca]|uniref:Toprim domain-containing protein n=1 Tax=Runella aurantiaca TaxID=2282308 RepID=A0A369HYG9_9BACT|nr:DUF6371 domain-containing protein [Runella aurantiaca]RDB02398.1 hypothetical protein DVG78_29125 [Runella aurantiaca]